jgi:hypothetical protein
MNRPTPKTFVVAGKGMFSYYETAEVNRYLAAKELEIQGLKRANQALRLQLLGPR